MSSTLSSIVALNAVVELNARLAPRAPIDFMFNGDVEGRARNEILRAAVDGAAHHALKLLAVEIFQGGDYDMDGICDGCDDLSGYTAFEAVSAFAADISAGLQAATVDDLQRAWERSMVLPIFYYIAA